MPPPMIAIDPVRTTTVMRNAAVLAGRARSYGMSCALKAWNSTTRMTGINQNQARRRAPVQTNESVPMTPKIAPTDVKMGVRFGTICTAPEAGAYTTIRYARKYATPATITQQPAPTTVIAKVRGTCGCFLGAVAFACWLISVASTALDPHARSSLRPYSPRNRKSPGPPLDRSDRDPRAHPVMASGHARWFQSAVGPAARQKRFRGHNGRHHEQCSRGRSNPKRGDRSLKTPHVSQTHTLRRRRTQPSPRAACHGARGG